VSDLRFCRSPQAPSLIALLSLSSGWQLRGAKVPNTKHTIGSGCSLCLLIRLSFYAFATWACLRRQRLNRLAGFCPCTFGESDFEPLEERGKKSTINLGIIWGVVLRLDFAYGESHCTPNATRQLFGGFLFTMSRISDLVFFFRMIDTTKYFKNSELRKFISRDPLFKEVNLFLEIGTFEGMCSLYVARFKNIGQVHTVDPFPVVDPGTAGVTTQTGLNFKINISKSKHHKKVRHYHSTSNDFFTRNELVFDMIYVDGSHNPGQAVRDLCEADRVLRRFGILWIDDYGSNFVLEGESLSAAISDWIETNQSRYEILHSGYQLGLRKIF
jgi:hypothetical protein